MLRKSTRTFSVTVESGGGYDVGDPSAVEINVLNNDSAVVSILAVSGTVDEGTPAQFEVRVSNEIATTLTATISLTAVGDFGINLDDTDVVIVAGETRALLTVGTTDDDIDEDNGSLTATIDSLALSGLVSGVQPTISDDNSSAMVTILDNDLAVVVSITTLEGQASTTISEANDVMLRLTLSRAISQDLQVNLNSVGDSGLVARVPTVVEVPSNTATHEFTVPINDMIVAQPDRNIDISVATGNGYIPSPDSVTVTVNVIDEDTAEVTISPVSESVTRGDDAKFDVVLGLMTAVDVEIGIDVQFGGGFITDENRGRTTVTVLAGQMSTVLAVPTLGDTGIQVNSSLVATLVAIPHLDLFIGDPSSATLIINALLPLSIAAMPDSLSLREMAVGDSIETSVSLNRIEGGDDVIVTITIDPSAGTGLTVSPLSLTFRTTEAQTVTVTAAARDEFYTGDRSAILTLSARGYVTETVTVTIIEDTPQPVIDLRVTPTDLNLVRFTSTEIEVSVDVDAILDVETTGAVRLTGDSMTDSLDLSGITSTRIAIVGVSEGMGTVTVTARGTRAGTGAEQETRTVSVMVSTPILVITGVPTNINLLTRETTVVTVSVSAIGGHSPTLTAMVTGTGNSVTPTVRTDVAAGMETTFRVTAGLVAGNETLTLTASHPDYEPASTQVPVDVSLRPIELSVAPSPLEIVSEMSADLTITATPTVTITIISGDAGIASVPVSAARFELEGGADNSARINVSGGNVDNTTLTIEASAAGYTTETITVDVNVLESLRIAAMPVRLSLVEGGASTPLSVSLNRIDTDSGTVGVTINLQDRKRIDCDTVIIGVYRHGDADCNSHSERRR